MQLTKKQVTKIFESEVLVFIKSRYEQDGKINKTARSNAWLDFVYQLSEHGQITTKQYDTWLYPKCCN